MLMIYGATGFTGGLILDEALKQGLKPIICGRGANAEALAAAHGLEARRADLSDPAALRAALQGVTLLINSAGPFSLSGPPLMEACIAAGASYMDIAGEVPEHLNAQARDAAARAAGVTLMPGVGFGVVPTECVAALAARALPGATALTIAYETRGEPSRGTLETVIPALHTTGWRRRAGALVEARPGQVKRTFKDGGRKVAVVANPWRADLVSAGVSTGIADIDAFSNFPFAARLLMRIGGTGLGRAMASGAVKGAKAGPDAAARAKGGTTIWAEARRGEKTALVTLRGPDAYDFTARCAVACARRAMEAPPPAGFQTPVTAFGADLVRTIQGVEIL